MGDTGDHGTDPPEVLASGRERPGPYERWSALPVRLRRVGAAVVCLALLAAGTAYALGARHVPHHSGHRSGSGAARSVPYPAQAVHITFTRLVPGDRGRRTFTVELRAAAATPLSVLEVTQSYEALKLYLAQRPPVHIAPGHPHTLTLRARVSDCSDIPLHARSPFLDVTLRNARAWQEMSVIPGDRYARALTHAFRTLCRPHGGSTGPNP